MSDSPPDSLIPYDEIVQEALRAVVGRVLGEVQAAGGTLPGEHHFYITFKTGAPDVAIPPHLKERFPDEMTIVLQNKFWDLAVDDEGFQVGLSFNQIPAKLQIPFAAITAFVDPAVDFGLQFQTVVAGLDAPEPHDEAENDSPEHDGGADVDPGDGSNVVTVDFGRKK
ncbi:MAG: SspB family protein [Novosphingobium sp.]